MKRVQIIGVRRYNDETFVVVMLNLINKREFKITTNKQGYEFIKNYIK